jgi:glutamate formiminotransferase / 5-formyltetrahydrofolate cyclo-ligase
MREGEMAPEYGPGEPHPSGGALLVTARAPLVAFNVDLDTDDVELAKRTAASLRESGGGFEGVRALGLYLPKRKRAQVSMNVHDHRRAPLRDIVAAIAREAPIAEVELVGLAPKAAFEGFPEDLPMRDFDPRRHLIENALGSLD